MNEQNSQKKKRLDETVKSRIKGLGLDALFHQIDLASKDSPSSVQSSPGYPATDKPQNRLGKFVRCVFEVILEQISRTKKLIFGNKHANILGLYFDRHSIRGVHFKEVKGSYQIAGIHYSSVPDSVLNEPQNTNTFTCEKIKEFIEKINIKNFYIINLIPRYKAIVKTITLPTRNPEEIDKMIRFEAEHLLSFPLHQLEFDYHIVSTTSDSSQIILTAVKKDILKETLSVLSQAGITPDAIDLTSFVLSSIYANDADKDKLIVNSDMEFTDINLIGEGSLKASRGIAWGTSLLIERIAKTSNITKEVSEKLLANGGILNEAESNSPVGHDISRLCTEWAEKLVGEIGNTTSQWPEDHVQEIVLTGPCAEIKNIDSLLKEKLNIPVKLAEIQYCPSENTPFNLLENHPFRFHTLLGLTGHSTVNLIPSNIKAARQRSEKTKFRATCLTLIAIIFLLCYLIPQLILSLRNVEIVLLDKELKKLNPQVQIIQEQKSRIQSFEDYIASKQSSLEALRELSLILSPDTTINTYTFEKNNYVLLRGEASSNGSVVNLAKTVRESQFFSDAILKYTKRKNRLSEDVIFEILCHIK